MSSVRRMFSEQQVWQLAWQQCHLDSATVFQSRATGFSRPMLTGPSKVKRSGRHSKWAVAGVVAGD